MVRQRRPRWPWAVLLLCGCAPGEAPDRHAGLGAEPTALDINDAMGASMPPLSPEEGGYVCAIATDVKCVRTSRLGRYQCAYRANGETRRTIVERTARNERDREGRWRWVSGWKQCGILY